jgi:ubiquinone biosynthesis protein
VSLKQDIKDLQRLRQILVILFEEGFGYYLNRSELRKHLPFHKKVRPAFPVDDRKKQAVYLRKAFERLGPTFVKFGQLLSLRPDLVPKEFSEEFSKLQDQVPPFHYSEAKKIIESEFHKPLSQVFRNFEKKPLASASISQVHRAELLSGRKVAVKIQRPEIKEIIDTDLDILFFIAKSLENHFSDLKNYQPLELVKEFALWTRQELNFEIEANRALRLQEEMKDNPKVKIPRIYLDLSSPRVLTMEYIDGVKLDDFEKIEQMNLDRKELAEIYFNSILEQSLLNGLFHADPHPGNIFVLKDGRLVFLDYGIMGEISSSDRKKIISFIESIPEKDSEKSFEIVLSLAREVKNGNVSEFKRNAIQTMENVYFHNINERSIGKALYDIISSGARHGIIFDPSHILMAKAVYQAEGMGRKLYPQFKISEGLEKFAQTSLQKRFSPLYFAHNLKKELWRNQDLLLDFPEHLRRIIDNLENPKTKDDSGSFKILEEKIDRLQNERNLGFLVLILIVASSFFFYAEGKSSLFGINLSTIFLFAAIITALYFLVITIRKRS